MIRPDNTPGWGTVGHSWGVTFCEGIRACVSGRVAPKDEHAEACASQLANLTTTTRAAAGLQRLHHDSHPYSGARTWDYAQTRLDDAGLRWGQQSTC